MGEQTNIQWCDHTFNAWRGCTKVSPGCKFCYAETLSKRNPAALGNWGPKGIRVVAAESYWRQPIKWNANARTAGRRARVFCASLADAFEGPDTMPDESWPIVEAARLRLFDLIRRTPHLDWLLLTKRPEEIHDALERAATATYTEYCQATKTVDSNENILAYRETVGWLTEWYYHRPPANVWLGTSVENQEQADIRVGQLLAAPAAVRFLSCEPLLGGVSLDQWLKPQNIHVSASNEFWQNETSRAALSEVISKVMGQTCGLHWVIVGGESGPKARPMHPNWARGLRDQCQAAGVPFHFKQWGEWGPTEAIYAMYPGKAIIPARLGYKLHDFTPGLIKRSMDDVENEHIIAWKLGKHAAGRLLDSQEHTEFPTLAAL